MPLRRTRLALAVTLSLSIAAPSLARGQDVSRDLLLLVLRQNGEGVNVNAQPVVANGEIPAPYSAQLSMPRGTHVAGAIEWPGYVDVFATSPGTIDVVRQWFVDDFKKRGYAAVEPYPNLSASGGFRDPSPALPSGYCSNGQLFTVTSRPHDATTTEFRIRIAANANACRGNAMSFPRFVDPSLLPMLVNPSNAQRVSRCFDPIANGSGEQLSTNMAPADLVKHYGSQLESLGWKNANVLSSASGAWVKKDSAGRDVTLTLAVTSSPRAPDCRSVTMSVLDPNR
jgi:hypothetical protein